MQVFIHTGLRLAILTYTLLHFITYFFEKTYFLHVLSVSGLFLLVFAGMSLSLKKFKLPSILFVVGLTVLFFSGSPVIDGFLNGLLKMRDVIGFLVVIPMISWVLNEEPYIEKIMRVSSTLINTSRKFYFGVMSFTQIISNFLLFGSIPIMYQFLNIILPHQEGEAWENFKGTALLRGYALTAMWVVSMPSFIYAVETLNASLWIAIMQGLGAAICGIIIAVIFSYFDEKRYGIDLTTRLKLEIATTLQDTSKQDRESQNVVEFFLLFISLFGTIFLIHGLFGFDPMTFIPMVVMVWASVFYIIKKRIYKFFKELKKYVTRDITKQSYQLSVMLGIGMLIVGLNQTDFGTNVINGVYSLQTVFPFINFLYLLPFIVVLLGLIGFGPLTVMVLVAGILENVALPYPPELIVLTVTSGSVISILLSPLIMPVIVLNDVNGLSGFKNGIQFNLKYAIVFYAAVQLYVQLMIHV